MALIRKTTAGYEFAWVEVEGSDEVSERLGYTHQAPKVTVDDRGDFTLTRVVARPRIFGFVIDGRVVSIRRSAYLIQAGPS